MKKRTKATVLMGLKIFIIPFAIIFIWLVLSILFGGCKSEITNPIETISGRYQSESMILLLSQNGVNVSATLEWGGYTTDLTGKYDETNKQVIMAGNYFGNQNISFNLIYANQSLAGGYNYNGQGTQAISLRQVGKLKKTHDQGGIGDVY